MLKLTVAVLAAVLAGSASAAGWRDLRVDGSSEEAFAQSLTDFKKKLPSSRAYIFGQALKDIWIHGTKEAEAAGSEYAAADYYRALDGLGYEQVVNFTDPTGKTARAWQREAYARNPPPMRTIAPSQGTRPAGGWGSTPESLAQGMQQCRCGAPNGPQGN